MPGGFHINIGGKKVDLSNVQMKLDNIQDAQTKKALSLFDIDGNGVLSKNELKQASIFYKEGYTQLSQENQDGVQVRDIWARKKGGNPAETIYQDINETKGNVYLEHTFFDNNGDIKSQKKENYTMGIGDSANPEEVENQEE
ncbi:hypothetical protein IJI31_02150 [bacterium]|nr:hypothetical protein [bacterium]